MHYKIYIKETAWVKFDQSPNSQQTNGNVVATYLKLRSFASSPNGSVFFRTGQGGSQIASYGERKISPTGNTYYPIQWLSFRVPWIHTLARKQWNNAQSHYSCRITWQTGRWTRMWTLMYVTFESTGMVPAVPIDLQNKRDQTDAYKIYIVVSINYNVRCS